MPQDIGKCDECERPATHMARDAFEGVATGGYRTWRTDNEVRRGRRRTASPADNTVCAFFVGGA